MAALRIDPLLEAALDCVDGFYARMFRMWPGAVNRMIGGCTVSCSGDTRLTGANHVWPTQPDSLNDEVLRFARHFFQEYHAAWSVVFTDSHMPLMADYLGERGFTVRWSSPLMVLDRPPEPLDVNPNVRVIRASKPQHIEDVNLVMAEAFAAGNSVNRRVVRNEHLSSDDVRHYLIYSGDQPAACATVALAGSTMASTIKGPMAGAMAGIWNVGTRYRFRRQRFATTIMRALLDDLRAEDCPASMLMASPAGLPLYEQLGYRQIGLTYYMGPPYYSNISS